MLVFVIALTGCGTAKAPSDGSIDSTKTPEVLKSEKPKDLKFTPVLTNGQLPPTGADIAIIVGLSAMIGTLSRRKKY